ncbi:MAG: hypothetical protein ACK5F4_04875 [Ignavibacteria bacterium]|jgi:hypothetical protein
MVHACFVFVLSAFCCLQLNAQNNNANNDAENIKALKLKPRNGLFYLSMGSGNPQGDFQSNIGTGGFAFLMGGGYSFEPILPAQYTGFNASLVLGMDLGYVTLNRNRRPASFTRFYDDYIYTNSVVPIDLFARLQLNLAQWVFPYAEITGGLNIFSATTDGEYRERVVRDGREEWETRTDELYSSRNVFWKYGIGTGVMIKLVENITLPNKASSILLDIKARYNYGTRSDYQKVIDVDQFGTTKIEEYANAGTDILFVQAGIAFRF